MFPRKIKDKDFQTLSSRAELPKVHLMFGNPLFTVFFSRSIFKPLTSTQRTPHVSYGETYPHTSAARPYTQVW